MRKIIAFMTLVSIVLCISIFLYPRPVVAGEVILCFGDSVTACTPAPLGACPFGEAATFRAGLAVQTSSTVINGGLSGDNTADAIPRLDGLLSQHSPNIIIIMFGLNDEAEGVSVENYVRNLSTFIRKSRRKGASVLLMTPNATRESERNSRLKPYVEACRKLADEHRVKLVDNYKAFCEANVEGLLITSSTYDAIHPNEVGQKLILEGILKSLSKRK